MKNIKILFLQQTCWACPSQWEGITENLNPVYIRYRWGVLSCEINFDCTYISLDTDNLDISTDAAKSKNYYYREQVGDPYDGCMNTVEMMDKLNFSFLLEIDQKYIEIG